MFLANGANSGIMNNLGRTALQTAIMYGNEESATILENERQIKRRKKE